MHGWIVSFLQQAPSGQKERGMKRVESFVRDFPEFKEVAIFWDSENAEYQVRVRRGNASKWDDDATYYTDNKVDALLTARHLINKGK